MNKFLISIVFLYIYLTVSSYSYDQKIWDNWYFGRRAGITFKTSDREPVPLKDGQLSTLEGCASISDTNGNLLFYTNGVTVFNKRHEIMANGEDLKGHNSSTQSALILRKPKSKTIFYIFTTYKGPYLPDPETVSEFCYSIVDIDGDNGKGEVIEKNLLIFSPVVEKLTAVQHANGEDYWIITKGLNNNKFIVTAFNKDGLGKTEVYETGPVYNHSVSPELTLGQLKVNLKGDMLATVVYGRNNVEIYKFNNLTGEVTDYLGIPVEELVTALYGVEFSSNNKFLYVSNLYGRLYQYDISAFDSLKIAKSMKLMYDSLDFTSQELGQLQSAPNGKIYMALNYDSNLAVIQKPNVPYPFCRFVKKGTGLAGKISMFGLPNNVITGIIYSVDVYGRNICLGTGDSIALNSIVFPENLDYIYEWTGPNSFKSSQPNPVIYSPGKVNAGKYVCRVTMGDNFFRSDSVEIQVYDIPESEISGPANICPPEIIKLSSKFKQNEYSYRWSTGETTPEILITSPGFYYLIITNPGGCSDSSGIEIVNGDNLSIVFEENNHICKSSPVEISLLKELYTPLNDFQFKWSTGDTTISTIVTKKGYYTVTVRRSGGCIGMDSVYVDEVEAPFVKLNIKDTVKLCSGPSVLIEAVDTKPEWTYKWADGYPELNREVTVSGRYVMYVSNQGACTDSAFVNVEFYDKPSFEILHDNPLEFCYGDSVKLRPSIVSPGNIYKWSNGSTSPEITVKQSGIYRLTAINPTGCSDSAETEVLVSPPMELSIHAEKTILCLSDSTTLVSNGRYESYKWSNGDTNDFIRVYTPGIYSLTVKNKTGCIDTAQIEIKGIDISSSISKTEFRFDSLCVGDEISDEITVSYNSVDLIEFDDLVYTGDEFNFDLEQSLVQESGGLYNHKINFRLGKNKPGLYRGNILLTVLKPCFNQYTVPLFVKIYSDFTFSAGEITSEAGDSVCMKIEITPNCGGTGDYMYSPEFDLAFDAEYFHPVYAVGGKILTSKLEGKNKIIKIKSDEQKFQKNIPVQIDICGITLSGQKETAPITVSNAEWQNDYIYSKYINGSFKIEGCSQNLRTLKLFTPVSMTVSPSPASEYADVTIISQETGKHVLEVYSTDGRLVKTYELSGFENENMKVVNINTSLFYQGLYQLILKSPWNVLKGQLLIMQ